MMIENCGKCGSKAKIVAQTHIHWHDYYCPICDVASNKKCDETWNAKQRSIRIDREEKMLRAMMAGGNIQTSTKFGQAVAEVRRLVEAQDVIRQERYAEVSDAIRN